ncbi:MAG TPA: hypothetical protein VHR47_00975, partial [Bacillota bacterium]|nr:hypothetical protein [Bacillota bacterium]
AHGRAPLHHHHQHNHQRWDECPPGQSPQPPLPPINNLSRPMPQRMPRSISSFVAGFKSAATKRINEIRDTPGQPVWQTRFYDRIVWNEKEIYAVRRYIKENPERLWAQMNEKNEPR